MKAVNSAVERSERMDKPGHKTRRFHRPTGELQVAFGILHKTLDPDRSLPARLEYATLVRAAGWTVLPVEGYGHCNFTSEQILGAFAPLLE
jgi:hypothetical protein